MTRPADRDPLEELLSQAPELEGAEFASRVLRGLPPRRAARPWILGAGAALATGVAAALLAPPAAALGPALLAPLRGAAPAGPGLAALLALAALGVTAAVAAGGELGGADEPAPS